MDQKTTIPLAELGTFIQVEQDPIIFHKNLRRVDYVVGDAVGIPQGNNEYTQNSPIYGMLEVEKLLTEDKYITDDGVNLLDDNYRRFFGAPKNSGASAFEWTGEWTVTYETFRDMGAAFMIAMILIYILVVGLFGNFIVPAIIMVPIPLTLLGIIPGHWIFDAEFTATSMIGWIALAGIIVRNSILLVDYSIHEIQKGTPLEDAVILACKTRTRPIMITAFALVGGSMVILFDPIFQGMAISLLFGVLVSTLLTLLVIPLGCIFVGEKSLCSECGDIDSTTPLSMDEVKGKKTESSILANLWSKFIGFISVLFYLIRALFIMIQNGIKSIAKKNDDSPKKAQTETSKDEKIETEPVEDKPSDDIAKTKKTVVRKPRKKATPKKTVTTEGNETKTVTKEPLKKVAKKAVSKKITGTRGIRLKNVNDTDISKLIDDNDDNDK
jgi:hypothetical protein